MFIIRYVIIGTIVFFASLFTADIITGILGPAPYAAGIVHNTINLLIVVNVICTIIIVNTIKETFQNKK